MYDKDSPLAIVNRAKSRNNSSIGWVYKAEIFSVTENKRFHETISEINQGSQAFSKNSRGEYMIPIGNKIVFTDGNYDSPYIREIIEVLTEYQTEFETVRRRIYNVEKGKSSKQDEVRILEQVYGAGYIISYNSRNDGVYGWEDGRRKGKTRRAVIRNYLNKQNRAGNDRASREAQITETTPNTEASSTDGVFFNGETTNLSLSDDNVKKKQLEIIEKTNPAPDTYHTWIRKIEDIKTLAETLEDSDWADGDEFNPDLTRTMIEEAITSGKITVYSSYPIEQGVFVTPSYMEAASYSGDGNVYEKNVSINDVAWIDPTQGMYASVKNQNIKYSLSDSLEKTEEILYDKDSPLAIVNRATSKNNSSINWVYKAEIFSVTENKRFHETISEINQGSQAFSKNSRGEYMIPIGNKIVFTDGNYDSPYIREIIEVLTEYQTEFETVRECIFDVEKGKSSKQDALRYVRNTFGKGCIVSYTSRNNGVYGWEDGRRKGKTRRAVIRNYLNKQNRAGNDRASREAQITETTPNTEASSTDGVFFNGETTNLSLSDDTVTGKYREKYDVLGRFRGEDVRYQPPEEDIAPVRDDIPIRKDVQPSNSANDETEWRAMAESVVEPEFDDEGNWSHKYTEYNSTIRDTIRKKAITEVIRDIEYGTPTSELIFKANDAIKEYNNIISSHLQNEYSQEDGAFEATDYTESENIFLDVLYDRYICYEAAAKNPKEFLKELKKYAENFELFEENYGDAFSSAETPRKWGNLLDAVEDDIAPVDNSKGNRNHSTDDIVDYFGITNLNDSVQVQNRVFETLQKQGFFTSEDRRSRTDVNEETGMVIETNKQGIKTTFSDEHYLKTGKKVKKLKLETFRKLPQIIKTAKLTGNDLNFKKKRSSAKYVYFVSQINIDGENIGVRLIVRSSPQKNRFHVHQILLDKNKTTESNPVGISKNSKTGYDTFSSDVSIANNSENVNVEDIAPVSESEAAISDEAKKEKNTEKGTRPTKRSEYHSSIIEHIKSVFSEKGFDFDEVLSKAKNLSTFRTVDNTPQRVMDKTLGPKPGQILADETVNKVAQNESEGIRWLNSFTNRKNGVLAQLSKKYGIKPEHKGRFSVLLADIICITINYYTIL